MFTRNCEYSEVLNRDAITIRASNFSKLNVVPISVLAPLSFLCLLNDGSLFVSKIKYVRPDYAYCVERNSADFLDNVNIHLADVRSLAVIITNAEEYDLLFYGRK